MGACSLNVASGCGMDNLGVGGLLAEPLALLMGFTPLPPRSPPNNGTLNGKLAYSMEASENATHVTAPFQ